MDKMYIEIIVSIPDENGDTPVHGEVDFLFALEEADKALDLIESIWANGLIATTRRLIIPNSSVNVNSDLIERAYKFVKGGPDGQLEKDLKEAYESLVKD